MLQQLQQLGKAEYSQQLLARRKRMDRVMQPAAGSYKEPAVAVPCLLIGGISELANCAVLEDWVLGSS